MKFNTIAAKLLVLLVLLLPLTALFAQETFSEPNDKPVRLQHWMTKDEARLKHLIGIDATRTPPPPAPVTNFAEFDQVQSVLIRHQFGIPYALIAAMSQETGVTTIVTENNLNSVINQYQSNGVNLDNCDFIIASTNSYWTRDFGPWFVFDGNDEIGIVDFEYNRPRPLDNAIPAKVAQHLNVNLFSTDLLHTGGNYMTDGMGISASTHIVHTENANYTHAQIAQIMQDYYGIHTYHVVQDPTGTYINHIDTWAKYLAPDKILIRSVPTSHSQYNQIEAAASYFAAQTSSYGTPMQVYRVYTPNNQPYTNSLILNNRVFVPIMNSTWDAPALQVYQEAMPGYEILGFTGSWQSTDALHCRTIGITDLEKVHIHHLPILGEQPAQENYTIEATVKAFSGQPLHGDSVLIKYSINGAAWEEVAMTNASGQQWTGTISGVAQGSEVAYFIYAADMAGKRQNHPFIGEHDPHVFFAGEQAFAFINIQPEEINASVLEGEMTTETLTICNTGNLELYFNIEPNTAIYGTQSLTVPNSPAASAYGYNTLVENNWSDVAVGFSGQLAGVEVVFDWTTDNWPEEGSLHLESPAGTSTTIAGGIPNGSYTVESDVFEGEEVNGTWKIWIEDTYGDGGHQATNITLNFTLVISETDWLSATPASGIVQPGECIEVMLTLDASMLDPGNHSAVLDVASNDQTNQLVNVPVNLEVIEILYNTVLTPDTLWYVDPETYWLPQTATFTNSSNVPITITDVLMENDDEFMWMVEDISITLPHTLQTNESFSLDVVVLPIVKNGNAAILYDQLYITSDAGTDYLTIALDEDLLTGLEEQAMGSTVIYPNPFSSYLKISYANEKTQAVRVEVIDINGRVVKVLADKEMQSGMFNFEWNGTDQTGQQVKSGIWFIRIALQDQVEVFKILKMN